MVKISSKSNLKKNLEENLPIFSVGLTAIDVNRRIWIRKSVVRIPMSLPMFLFLVTVSIVSCSGRRPSMLCRSEADGREWALAPPDYLPPNFFNPDGSRVWAKLASGIHQCELCGYEAKTKNKYREKQVQHYSVEKDNIDSFVVLYFLLLEFL
jgi:hypothetical protein